jgi:hypothetical protein
MMRLFGAVEPRKAWLFFFALAFFPPSLALVGAAMAYELTGALWSTAVGVVYGAGMGVLWVRDFLRWRPGVLTVALTAVFAAGFLWAYA